MGDFEDSENEAVYEEDEYARPDDFTSRLINLAKSAARQAYCCGSVLIFPAFSPLFDLTWKHLVENYTSIPNIYPLTGIHCRTVFALSTSGLIVGAILLHFIGRKLTVIVTNLLELVFFLYAYLTDIEPVTPITPSSITVMHHFVTGVGFMTFFIYVSEIASPTFRAFFMGLYWLAVIICKEQFKGVILTKKLSDLFRNCSIIALFSLLLSLFIRETPFWLTLKGNAEKAKETFTWLRAGDRDRSEFDQMLDTADDIMENSFRTFIFASTFIVCLVSSFFLIMGTFNTCSLLRGFLHDNWLLKHGWLTYKEYIECSTVLFGSTKFAFVHQVFGQLAFLVFNFLLPRKVLYFISYIFSSLIVLPWALKIKSIPILTLVASFCNVAPFIGIASLNQILPVEIYPIALRSIGVVFAGSLEQLRTYLDKMYLTLPTAVAHHFDNRSYMFVHLYISVGIPLILIFMPETENKNIYELKEVKLELPLIFRGSAVESEGPVAGDESSAGPEAYD